MDRQLISEWFDYVPMLYWPVLCLEIVKFHLWAWADAETLGYARQLIVAVNDRGRIRVKFIEDAPGQEPDWQVILSANLHRLPGESRDPSLMLSYCAWEDFQSWTPRSNREESGVDSAALTPHPLLDPG